MVPRTFETEATYTIHISDAGNFVETRTEWERYTGKNNFYTMSRVGNIFTRSRFKSWLKKYNLPIKELEVELIPKKSVFGS